VSSLTDDDSGFVADFSVDFVGFSTFLSIFEPSLTDDASEF